MGNSAFVHLFVAFGVATWTIMDSRKRGKFAWGYAIGSALLLWWACLPFYLAGRKLLPGETREGGYGWNACKFFMLTWSALLGYCMILGMMAISEQLDGRAMSGAQSAGAAIGVGLGMGIYFCLWIGVIIPAGIIGLLLKKNSIVEKGDAAASQPTQASTPVSPPAAPSQAHTPPPAPNILISVARRGETIGTYDPFTFGKLVASGEIHPTDHYWKQGMAKWDIVLNYRG